LYRCISEHYKGSGTAQFTYLQSSIESIGQREKLTIDRLITWKNGLEFSLDFFPSLLSSQFCPPNGSSNLQPKGTRIGNPHQHPVFLSLLKQWQESSMELTSIENRSNKGWGNSGSAPGKRLRGPEDIDTSHKVVT
jgi:hypothetical protein